MTGLVADLAARAMKTTLVVAASGGDYATIDAALAAVPAGGAEIFVKRGLYTIASTLTVPSNTTICGEGEGTEVKLGNSAGVNMFYVGSSATDVVIRDLKINGNRANNSATYNGVRVDGSRVRVINVHVTGANGYNLVAWTGSSDVHFISCVSEDARDEGIEFMGCVRGSAVGNHVRNIGKNAILVWANVAQGGTSSGITIADNVVSGASALTSGFAGIKIDDGATDVAVTGNVVLAGGTSSPGIRVDSNSANVVSNITVTGNTVVGSTAEGILVGFASNVVVEGNAVRGCATAGIKLSGATCTNGQVVGNTSSGNTLYGIYADTVTGPHIVGNVVSGNTQQGMLINACTDATVTGNRVVSNGGTTYGGLDITNSTGGVVCGNTIRGTGAHGISTQGSSGLTVSGNHVAYARAAGIALRDCTNIACAANVTRNNGQGGNTTFYNGIVVWRVSAATANIVVIGNRCFDDQATKTQGYGIRTIGAVDNVRISNNVVDGNSVSGFNTDGSATNLYIGIDVVSDGSVVLAGGPKIMSGAGTPEGAATAPVGSVWLRTDGSGQGYVKVSGTGNTGWVQDVTASTVDAKGDLLVGTADNAVARLAVGANGYRPVADSTAATGIAWTLASPDIQTFTASGTWTKPAGAKTVQITLIGGGGGGASGRRGAVGTACGGGGAGAGGAVMQMLLPASALGATESVTVGAGGSGAAAQTADDTNGTNGTNGADSSFGAWCRAYRGLAGAGGTTAGGAGGQALPGSSPGGAGGAGGAAGLGVPPSLNAGAPGGCGGSGISSANVAFAGTNRTGTGASWGTSTPDGAGGVIDGAAAGNGTNAPTGLPLTGTVPGGGASSITTNAGAGGAAALYGGGGSGGGASRNVVSTVGGNSGPGGAGASGIAQIVSFF